MPEHEHLPPRIRVWDLPTRLFHWALVALVGLSWASGEIGLMELHIAGGLTILALLIFRLAWGVVGSTTARFTHFVRHPRAARAYLAHLLRADTTADPPVGHNPAGGLMIVGLLAVLLLQVVTGLFANDDIYSEGPLAHWVSKGVSDALTEVHEGIFGLLVTMIAVHILAAVSYLVLWKENLIQPMITGWRPWPADKTPPALRFTSPVFAVAIAAAAAGLAWWVSTL